MKVKTMMATGGKGGTGGENTSSYACYSTIQSRPYHPPTLLFMNLQLIMQMTGINKYELWGENADNDQSNVWNAMINYAGQCRTTTTATTTTTTVTTTEIATKKKDDSDYYSSDAAVAVSIYTTTTIPTPSTLIHLAAVTCMTYALDHNLQKRTNDADASETNDNDLADNPLFFGTLKLWISSPRLSLRDVLGVGGGG